MEKINEYRNIVKRLATEYANDAAAREVELEFIQDPALDHYEVQWMGFDKSNRRIQGTLLHLDIRNGKVWLQYNGTDRHIAEELVEAGIPKSDIVLGFQPPYKRPFTGYATG